MEAIASRLEAIATSNKKLTFLFGAASSRCKDHAERRTLEAEAGTFRQKVEKMAMEAWDEAFRLWDEVGGTRQFAGFSRAPWTVLELHTVLLAKRSLQGEKPQVEDHHSWRERSEESTTVASWKGGLMEGC